MACDERVSGVLLQREEKTHATRVDEVDHAQRAIAARSGSALLAHADCLRLDLEELRQRRPRGRVEIRLDEGRVGARRVGFGGHLFEEVAVERLNEGGVGDSGGFVVVVHEAESGDCESERRQ